MKCDDKTCDCCQEKAYFKNHQCHHRGGDSGAIYGLGVVGALFYYLQGATTFIAVIIGIGKSFFWPAILLFQLLTYLKL